MVVRMETLDSVVSTWSFRPLVQRPPVQSEGGARERGRAVIYVWTVSTGSHWCWCHCVDDMKARLMWDTISKVPVVCVWWTGGPWVSLWLPEDFILRLAAVWSSWYANDRNRSAEIEEYPHKTSWTSYFYWFLYQTALLPSGHLLCLTFTVRTKDDVRWLVLWMTILEQSSKASYLKTIPHLRSFSSLLPTLFSYLVNAIKHLSSKTVTYEFSFSPYPVDHLVPPTGLSWYLLNLFPLLLPGSQLPKGCPWFQIYPIQFVLHHGLNILSWTEFGKLFL